MPSNWNLQWLNHNSQRSYPIVDWASGEDTSGSIKIPDSFILSFYLPVHAGLVVQPEKFFIKALSIYPNGFSITIGYDNGGTNPVVATVNIDANQHSEYTPYTVAGSGDFTDSIGHIVIGNLDEMNELPAGYYTFAPAATYLEIDTIRPMIRGISSLVIVNGTDRSDPIYGDVELVAGNNMRLVVNQVEGEPVQIVFSAIDGEGLNEECACDDESDPGQCIKFINGIPPLPDGNFKMVGNKCIDVRPIPNGLQFVDLCAEPCCGCEELEAIIRQVDRFADGVATYENAMNNLTSEVTVMRNVVLGSRIGDDGCTTC